MRDLSTAELRELGADFGIEVDDAEADAIRAAVNEKLDGLDALDDLPIDGHEGDVGARTWHEPDDDPLNAVAAECEVPPSGDGVLDGAAVGVKDIVAVAGVPMACGSAVMRGYVPGFDATVVDRLRAAGATITCKTALDEFAGSGRGTTGHGGPIRNPHDPERTAGGSSGGSAVAVATGRVDAALGSDTGGSIRMPAGLCGVVGFKPTYGLVPLSGVVENTYTQDHVGPLTTTVAGAARVLAAIAGKDPDDPASLQAAGRDGYRVGGYVDAVADPPAVDDLTLGRLEEGVGDGVADAVVDRTGAALDALADAGATVEPVSIGAFRYGRAIKDTLSYVELATHWRAGGAAYRRGGGIDEGYQVALARRAAAASGELSAFYRSKLLAGARIVQAHDGRHYTRAQAAREALRDAFDDALAGVDALCLPTMPDVAPPVEDAADPGFDYARNTRAADVTRLPAVSLPNGAVDGLPVGLQLVGEAFADDALLGIAAAVEPSLG